MGWEESRQSVQSVRLNRGGRGGRGVGDLWVSDVRFHTIVMNYFCFRMRFRYIPNFKINRGGTTKGAYWLQNLIWAHPTWIQFVVAVGRIIH